jgi:hypothetical protein
MKTKSYVIPTEVDEFIDFESILIYLLHTYASEWNIPSDAVLRITEKCDQFEHILFHVMRKDCLLQPDLNEELHVVWAEFKLMLAEFYEQYLLNNDAITDEYKTILAITASKPDSDFQSGILRAEYEMDNPVLF